MFRWYSILSCTILLTCCVPLVAVAEPLMVLRMVSVDAGQREGYHAALGNLAKSLGESGASVRYTVWDDGDDVFFAFPVESSDDAETLEKKWASALAGLSESDRSAMESAESNERTTLFETSPESEFKMGEKILPDDDKFAAVILVSEFTESSFGQGIKLFDDLLGIVRAAELKSQVRNFKSVDGELKSTVVMVVADVSPEALDESDDAIEALVRAEPEYIKVYQRAESLDVDAKQYEVIRRGELSNPMTKAAPPEFVAGLTTN